MISQDWGPRIHSSGSTSSRVHPDEDSDFQARHQRSPAPEGDMEEPAVLKSRSLAATTLQSEMASQAFQSPQQQGNGISATLSQAAAAVRRWLWGQRPCCSFPPGLSVDRGGWPFWSSRILFVGCHHQADTCKNHLSSEWQHFTLCPL